MDVDVLVDSEHLIGLVHFQMVVLKEEIIEGIAYIEEVTLSDLFGVDHGNL